MLEQDLIKQRIHLLSAVLDERSKRLVVAAEAKVLGYGGVTTISKITGVSRNTISAGINELNNKELEIVKLNSGRIRNAGGGRKKLIETNPTILEILKKLVEPTTRGDPESPLLWTCKSLRKLADEMKLLGHNVGRTTIASMLETLNYSLQANHKTLEGSKHIDRNAQFELINQKAKETLLDNNPVISVDTKKKELIGQYKNQGETYRPKGQPEKVNTYDFINEELGKANPYGVYDIANNTGWISVGTDHDTSTFAVETIRRWWHTMGKIKYPNATELMITADGGGSNGSRVRLWKQELQNFANEIGFSIRVSHFPPGTSKWNKIEHRMFSHISMNWRGRPLISHEVIVNLIANTTTKTGLKIQAGIDDNSYPIGIKVSDEDFRSINIERDKFRGEWNYVIRPNMG
jgi:DNA-binding transcriptional regulator GbsR (MarR family)